MKINLTFILSTFWAHPDNTPESNPESTQESTLESTLESVQTLFSPIWEVFRTPNSMHSIHPPNPQPLLLRSSENYLKIWLRLLMKTMVVDRTGLEKGQLEKGQQVSYSLLHETGLLNYSA